ncbi:hypothetical protein NDU88_003442 [Pleurodeles waltl]|uniref:Uncharacterized protein n=1 Tax=Pleurodeles waltl TaxID=8319 RepID=A0AAV7QCT4_PLEWA|nr:hypothetical protein NDU88_003442 [Pleurodeles waltl]
MLDWTSCGRAREAAGTAGATLLARLTRVDPSSDTITDYLTHIAMPRLTQEDREALGAPLTLSEITKALGGVAEGMKW